MSNAVISVSGEQSARTYGLYTVVLSLPIDGGYAINVHAATGGHRYAELCFTTPDVDTANLVHRIIKTGGEQGVTPDGIRAALDDALRQELLRVQSRRDLPSRNRIEHINRMLDTLETDSTRAAVAELVDDVTAFLTGHTQPRTIADTVPTGTHRQMRPTMAGAHLTRPSDPAQRVLRAAHANGGTIARSKAATVVQLQALARKGLVTLNYATGTGRRRVVESATLTSAGVKAVTR